MSDDQVLTVIVASMAIGFVGGIVRAARQPHYHLDTYIVSGFVGILIGVVVGYSLVALIGAEH